MNIYQGHNSGGSYNYNAYFYTDCHWYLHFHKNYELAFVLEGQTELTVSGRSFSVEAGSFALVLPHELHGYRTPSHSLVWIGVFSADFVESFAGLMAHKRAENPVFSCSEPVLTFLRQQLITRKKQDVLMLQSALYAVCSEFLQNVTLEETDRDPGFAEQTITFVAEHFAEDITLQDLARSFGYEYHYASRQFHKHFPMHFKQFLNLYRTEFAREQLLRTDRSITQIALQSGFQNCRSFNRAFLEQMGVTPSTFRKQYSISQPVQYLEEPIS